MRIVPIHHVLLKPEDRNPFTAAFAVEDSRIIFFSGCETIPIYHKHPNVPEEEEKWLKGDIIGIGREDIRAYWRDPSCSERRFQ
jgi:hypothetical protein